ncbi:MAG: radical SAM protein, partial [Proteobacteria bacterium]|nr:radical SAM protein [Pseudomonadota bacterium]
MFAKAMYSKYHPIQAHIVPMRKCNLACTYCNEFDDVSKPVPVEEMLRRVDKLVELGTTIVTISGGEPLLHPELERIVSRIRSHGMLATLITNGYLMVPDRIKKLNAAGLDYVQISIDNVQPDDVSKKSLKVLDQKLQWMKEHAEFSVTINSVLGSSIDNPEDAEVIARRARELGFTSTVGVIHDHDGQLKPLDARRQGIYQKILKLGTPLFSFAQFDRFQKNITSGRPNQWHCRAGARYVYICEDGLVHWCSQQRGMPGKPLAEYTLADLKREAERVKDCAPYCTVSCVHQVSMLDAFREAPSETLHQMMESRQRLDPNFRVPMLVKALDWMFLREENKKFFTTVAIKVFGLKRPELTPASAMASASSGASSSLAPDVRLEQILPPTAAERRGPQRSRAVQDGN